MQTMRRRRKDNSKEEEENQYQAERRKEHGEEQCEQEASLRRQLDCEFLSYISIMDSFS